MSSADGQSHGASLLGLPVEIRLKIFRCLFEDAKIHLYFDSEDTCQVRDLSLPTQVTTIDYHPAISGTSRQLRDESFPIQCRDTAISICDIFYYTTSSRSSIQSIPRYHLRNARYLTTDEGTRLNLELPEHCHNLEILTLTRCCDINLSRPRTPSATSDELLISHLIGRPDNHFEQVGKLMDAAWSKPVKILCEAYFPNVQEVVKQGVSDQCMVRITCHNAMSFRKMS